MPIASSVPMTSRPCASGRPASGPRQPRRVAPSLEPARAPAHRDSRGAARRGGRPRRRPPGRRPRRGRRRRRGLPRRLLRAHAPGGRARGRARARRARPAGLGPRGHRALAPALARRLPPRRRRGRPVLRRRPRRQARRRPPRLQHRDQALAAAVDGQVVVPTVYTVRTSDQDPATRAWAYVEPPVEDLVGTGRLDPAALAVLFGDAPLVAARQARPVLLASAGGRPPDAAAVRRHAAADLGAASAGRLTRGTCNAARLAKKGHTCGAVSETRPERRDFSGSHGRPI